VCATIKPIEIPMRVNILASLAASSLILLTGCGGTTSDGGSSALQPKLLGLVSSTTNVATFSGLRNGYTITANSTGVGYVVKENATGTSATTAATVTSLVFDDVTINLNVANIANTISSADLKRIVELYIAFFNRVPDADGMVYWIGQFKSGQTFNQLANTFYGIAISPDFTALTGYKSTMTSGDFVNIIYNNVLGHPAEAEGYNYWTNQLDTGLQTRGQLVQSILDSAHTFKGNATLGYVADLLDNKYSVGAAFAIASGLTFRSADAYTKSVTIAGKVTPTSTAAAITQFGIGDTAFNLAASSVVLSNINLSTPMYKKLLTITTTGQNLNGGVQLSVSNCTGLAESAGGTTTQRVFTCTPGAVGSLAVVMKLANDGTSIFAGSTQVPMPQVTMKTTMGDMVIELDPVHAPITTTNFLQYVTDGFYTGTIFHRVIAGFMDQGGGFNTSLSQLSTRAPIVLEAPNGLSNVRGTIAMARTKVRDSATSQFFINVVSSYTDSLDASATNDGYAVFGKVVTGMAVADAINGVQTVPSYGSFTDIPYTFIVITSVTQTQ
jgi:cyclophilin family peptidyl-prolyl cis-trans isomerase